LPLFLIACAPEKQTECPQETKTCPGGTNVGRIPPDCDFEECPITKVELEKHYCTESQKKADVCIQLYQPVCGWFDPEKMQCVKYPCAQTFSNSCFACVDEKVLYWTEGECPE